MALQGIFASHEGIVGDRVGDFASAVLKLWPTGSAPFLALSSGMAKDGVGDTAFTWFEDAHISGRTDAVSGGTGTAVVVADGSFYVAGNILVVEETGEYLLVTATSGNSLTVIRGFTQTPIVAITSAHHIQQIGNAHEEGSDMPTPVHQQGKPRTNYVQIFRNSWGITGTAKAVNFRTGARKAENKLQAAQYHAEDQERAFIWGRKAVGIRNNKQFRLTDGLIAQIQQNGGVLESANSGGAGQLNLGDFSDFIRRIFAKNIKGQPNERLCFGGDVALQVINRCAFLDSVYNISQGESMWGINITEIQTVFGKLKILTHPLMNENPMWAKELYVTHPGGIRRRVLRETFYDNHDGSGTRPNGRDADTGAMTTEAGIEVKGAATMGTYSNITTAVATN